MLSHCTHCQAALNVTEQHIGKQVRCPKCQQVITIAAPPSTAESSASSPKLRVAKPLGPDGATAPAARAASPSPPKPATAAIPPLVTAVPVAKATIPKVPAPPVAAPPIAAPPITVAAAAEPGTVLPVDEVPGAGGFPKIEVSSPPRHKASAAAHTKSKAQLGSKPKNKWLPIAGGGIAAVVLVGAIFAYVAMSSNSKPATNSTATATAPAARPTAKSPANSVAKSASTPRPGEAQLVLQWAEAERQGAAVTIDGQKQDLPTSGEVRYDLSAGDHRVVMQRRGYEQVELAVSLKSGDQHNYRPQWEKSFLATQAAKANAAAPIGFSSWEQNVQVVERAAKKQNTEILMLFAGSDWEPLTRRLAEQVFASREFADHIQSRYELLVIDFPRTQRGYNMVQDHSQNQALIAQYGIKNVPTVVLADSQAVPYAVERPVHTVASEFIGWLTELQQQRVERDRLLAATKTGDEAEQLAAAVEAVKWLTAHRLTPFQKQAIEGWLKLAEKLDAVNKQGQHELLFRAHWLNRLFAALATEDADQIRSVVVELEKWTANHTFIDHDLGGSTFFLAAGIMIQLEDEETALRLANGAQQFSPKDEALATNLKNLAAALKDRGQLGSGTGFAVGNEGYILTNHHVIAGPGRAVVRVAGREEPVPATIVAKDEKLDLALIKIDADAAEGLTPLPIDQAPLSRGSKVAAFGYPLGDILGSGIKLTTGVVSALPTATQEGMLILDCRINPGNSGGPLCNPRGHVVGIVTAKSTRFSDESVDTYGMAVPANEMIGFLTKSLPDFQPPGALAGTAVEWDVVDRSVSPSVVMILKVR